MVEFLRTIHKHLEYVLILNAEAMGYLFHQFQDSIPNPVGYTQFLPTEHNVMEKAADGFVVGEPLGERKDVVLHCCDGRADYPGGEIAHLILAESKMPLAFFEHDLDRPTHGINLVRLCERERRVGRDEPVPIGSLAALTEEEPHIASRELHIHRNVVIAKLAAPLPAVLGAVEHAYELSGCVLLSFIYVLGVAHLDHSQVMASVMAGRDELDDCGACEPSIGKQVVERDTLLDGALDHLLHQRDLTRVIFLFPLGHRTAFGMILGEACVELPLFQAVVAFLSLLAHKTEVERHLRLAVCDGETESLEPKHHGMSDMGVHLPDELGLDAAFGEVRVIHDETNRRVSGRAVLLCLSPKHPGDGGENLPPIKAFIREEPVEDILLAGEEAA